LATVVLIGAAVTHADAADAAPPKSFTYKSTPQGELSLHVYLPADWKADQRRPGIVFFFGGGFTKGTVKQFEPQSEYLAGRGMVAICADYRVKSRHGVAPDACVEDAKSAIRWVRQHAGELGIDPERLVGAGGSAGGHLAAATGVCPGLENAAEDQSISSQPNALVLFNPLLTFDEARAAERLNNDAALARALSPTAQLRSDSPPALILFGTDDKLLAQGEEFMARSRALGHRAELYLADGVGHGFFNRSPWRERTIARVDEFLVSLGYLLPSSP
jgi:acetyl esterase/lipase